MDLLFSNLLWWHWLVLGMVLLIIEIIAPASFFFWIAHAALLMIVLSFINDSMIWQTQQILFIVFSIASLFAGRAWFKNRPIKSDIPQLNRRAEQYIGRTFTLNEAIENGYGSVNVDDTRWRVTGPDLLAGQVVRVVGMDGMTFKVELVS